MRDTKKYAYYTVGIPRGSDLHNALLADAQELGNRYVPLMIRLWLKDHFQSKYGDVPTISPQQDPASIIAEEQLSIDLSNAELALDEWED